MRSGTLQRLKAAPGTRHIDTSITESTSRNAGDRLHIWEIDTSMHCSVLGTCLPLRELYSIARRASFKLDARVSAYQVHSWFVDLMTEPNELAKRVDKAIEKRHFGTAHAVRGATTEVELEQRWRQAHAAGQIAGAYWGAMSHPLCDKGLRWRLFGEIHMLSHLVGSAREADLCRLHEIDLAGAVRDAKHARLRKDHRALLKETEHVGAEHESRLQELRRAERLLADARERIAALESLTLIHEHEARALVLERALGEAEARRVAAESSAADLSARLQDAFASGELARREAAELAAENQALELELTGGVAASQQQPTLVLADLGGTRIMYVGGRPSLVPHYRALAKRHGGELLHHDGGLEESLDALSRALSSVDVVVCPVDCVSHAACLLAKKACHNMSKRFVPIRSSGLSCFARLLRLGLTNGGGSA